MDGQREPRSFHAIIDHFAAAERRALSADLDAIRGLGDGDRATLRAAGERALHLNAALKLNRVLLLELHAAERAGQLGDGSDGDRFDRFVADSLQPAFGAHLDRRYPPFRPRLARALRQQRLALAAMAARIADERDALRPLLGGDAGALRSVDLGLGDLHAGGHSVARLRFEGGSVMYKPRSLRIDHALDAFLADVFAGVPDRIRVPRCLDRGDHGWSAFEIHRHCDGPAELARFYRGLGHWLGLLRLIGGTDIHHENLIAVGPVPVVIDVESLFAPVARQAPVGYGEAHDLALTLIRGSVLRTGIVPFRAPALGFDGVDVSAAGALAGEQPPAHVPVIEHAGTPAARLKIVDEPRPAAQNHPTPDPDLPAYWDCISGGFLDACERLRRLDADGGLAPRLRAFAGCSVREIRRPTQVYAEIGRMLWHPAALHDEAAAIERARDLFVRNAAVSPLAPSTPEEIAGEIDDLRHGDIPVFAAPASAERIAAALADWRAMRVDLEELTIRSALVATELNRRPPGVLEEADRFPSFFARYPHADALDARRRRLAADAVSRLLRLAVRGTDGTVTWITPETSHTGWLVQPVLCDLYFGLGGVVVALAAYADEAARGRVDPIDGLADTLEGALRTLAPLYRHEVPKAIGGFTGHGGQLWTWLTLHDLLRRDEFLACAIERAEDLERIGFAHDQRFDIIDGAAGVIVPLLHLADATGDARWQALALRAAEHLEATAIVDAQGARWASTVYREPIGGFAHGVAGTGWALARLALSTAGDDAARARWRTLAEGAFDYQDTLYDATLANWLDQRQWKRGETFHSWCNGSVGIGLGAEDLFRRTGDARQRDMLRRAVAASRGSWGASHTLCHGDFSLWDLLVRADAIDPAACASDRAECTGQVLSAIEEHGGIVSGRTRAAFTPGLMTGIAGAVHGLVRMHPDCRLGSPLLFERSIAP